MSTPASLDTRREGSSGAPAPRLVHEHGLRVYWEDTDAGGVVFYANYLKFFERSRTEWMRRLGFSQEALRTATGGSEAAMFMVAATRLNYLAPARLDDWITVDVRLRDVGAATLELQQTARRDSQVLCEGDIRIACVHPATLKPRRIPAAVRAALDTR